MKKTLGKRLLSSVTSALISVSCVVTSAPMGMLTTSAADLLPLSNNENRKTDDVTLLVGETNPIRGETVAETLAKAEGTYALGIASQFAAFVKDDFTATDSDVEGRLAVGGDLLGMSWNGDTWFYEVGNGIYKEENGINGDDEFSADTGLDVVLGTTGYAHVIATGGSIQKVNITSGDAKTNLDGQKVNIDKKIVVSTSTDYSSYDTSYLKDSYKDHFYQTDGLFNVANYFNKIINNRSEILYQNDVTGTAEWDGNALNLTYTGDEEAPETIYFNVTDWNSDVTSVNIDVPFGSYVVINCDDEVIDIGKGSGDNQVYTKYAGSNIDKLSTKHNNMSASEYILYNFPKAETVNYSACFNGTILAPKADFLSTKNGNGGNPHLSGAVIVEGFNGCAEIGYRPFAGSVDMLGLTVLYTIDLDKFAEDGTTPLAGATLGLYSVKTDDNGNIITDENGDPVLELANTVETDGSTATVNVFPGKYVIKEISAPDGYMVDSDTAYYISIDESGKVKEEVLNGKTKYSPVEYIVNDNLAGTENYISSEDAYNSSL
ncbi:MAG: choice-of-anchor A family protein [Ruminococcus sp.]|nr:choice-of-anchor A family protein [Ruminococcus sp.]